MYIESIHKLESHLVSLKSRLSGGWVQNNSSYDGDICSILGMSENTVRYWDAIWGDLHIEFKKGNSIWLDLVRYSEILCKANQDAAIKTFTLFFIPNKERECIQEVIGVKTDDIIGKVGLTQAIAKELISLKEIVPRSLNAQASLTKNDVKKLATFIV